MLKKDEELPKFFVLFCPHIFKTYNIVLAGIFMQISCKYFSRFFSRCLQLVFSMVILYIYSVKIGVFMSDTYQAAVETSKKIEADLQVNPKKYRVLTGDRPTGRLHIGHYFGSLQNRVRLSKMGVPTSILIADYQVLTDHDAFSEISQNTKQLVIDYLAAGIVPSDDVIIYPHSYVPEANQLMIPFLTLVSNAELNRNPTVKEEIQSANIKNVNAGMLVYPVHQACDILSVNAKS